ncbi:MAG: hypothetical protein AB9835_11120 [Eubacteriales bacterium]
MITNKETTIAYHCPVCGVAMISSVNIFKVAGDLLKMKCECGGSQLDINITRDGKIRLTVPCLACPTPHIYTLSSPSFFGKDLFALSCAITGIDICFFGDKDKVLKALDDNEKELMELVAQNPELDDMDEYHRFDNEDDLDEEEDTEYEEGEDVQSLLPSDELLKKLSPKNIGILELILSRLQVLAREGRIICMCGSPKISVDIEKESVTLSCSGCGASRTIKARTIADAEYLDNVEMLMLD